MANYETPGEFVGTLGQSTDLFSVLTPGGIVTRAGFILTSPTQSAGILELFSTPPPLTAFGIPVWASITSIGTVATSRTWTLSSVGDSILAHLDSPLTLTLSSANSSVLTHPDGEVPIVPKGLDSLRISTIGQSVLSGMSTVLHTVNINKVGARWDLNVWRLTSSTTSTQVASIDGTTIRGSLLYDILGESGFIVASTGPSNVSPGDATLSFK